MIRIIIMTIIPNPDQMTIFRSNVFFFRSGKRYSLPTVWCDNRTENMFLGSSSKDPVIYVLIHSLLIFNIFSDTYYIKPREKWK